MSNFLKPINLSIYRSDDNYKKVLKNNTSATTTDDNIKQHKDDVKNKTKKLELLLQDRERQKLKMKNKDNFLKNNFNHKICPNKYVSNSSSDSNISCSKTPTEKCIYAHIWDAYWPLIGSCADCPQLDISVDYITFNGCLIKKWDAELSTPQTSYFPVKDLFKFVLTNDASVFDFDIKIENIPDECDPTIINIGQKSTSFPFNLNQYLVIKDPNINTNNKFCTSSNVQAVISYYQTNDLYLNQFTRMYDSFGTIKNLFLSTQLMVIHINQVKTPVKLLITYNTAIGD